MQDLAIGEASDSPSAGRMKVAMMTVRLGDGLIAAHAANGVFDDNAAAGEGGVEGYILWGTRLAFWFLARAMSARMAVSDPL